MLASAQTAHQATLGKLTLRVRGPAGTTQMVVLRSACCRIGSGDGCTLRLRAPGVRDVHCVISRGSQRTTVRGLAKETWLNGAVFFESPLAVGDCLRLGRLEIDVLEDERLVETDQATPAEEPRGHASSSGPPPAAATDARGEGLADANPPSAPAGIQPQAPSDPMASQLKASVEGQTASCGAAMEVEVGRLRGELPQDQAELTRLDAQAAPAVSAANSKSELSVDAWQELDDRLAAIEQLIEQQREQNDQPWQEIQRAFAGQLEERCATLEAQLAELRQALDERRSGQPIGSADSSDDQASLQPPTTPERQSLGRRLAAVRDEANDESRENESVEQRGTHVVSEEERRGWVAAADEEGAQESNRAQPEELTFEQVSHEAPLSTADVLRRMGVATNLGDDEPGSAAQAPSFKQPAAASSVGDLARPQAAQRPAAPSTGEPRDEGESIEQYMSQLMARLRTPKIEEAEARTASLPVAPPSSSPSPAVQPAVVETAKPPAPVLVERSPRLPSPERPVDLSAMRALANNTARQALDTYRRRGQVRSTQGKLLVAGIALAISVILMCFSTGNGLTLWASIASLVVSIYWGGRYVLLTRKLGPRGARGQSKPVALPTKGAAPAKNPDIADRDES